MELGEYNWVQGLTLKWNLSSAPWKDYCLTLKTYQHSIKLIYVMFSTLNDPRRENNGSYIFWIFLGVFSQAFNKFCSYLQNWLFNCTTFLWLLSMALILSRNIAPLYVLHSYALFCGPLPSEARPWFKRGMRS